MCKFGIPVMSMPGWWIITNIIVFCSAMSVIIAIIIDFSKYHKVKGKKEKKSIVETGTMVLFFLLFYFLLRFRIGSLPFNAHHRNGEEVIINHIGTLLIVAGSVINIWGRKSLGPQWSNQIKIYQAHKLIQNGPYKFIRHPLYSSLVLMFWGASIVYTNVYALIANTCIFLPFMYYRAKQEEEILEQEISDYKKYKKTTGAFFLKIWR